MDMKLTDDDLLRRAANKSWAMRNPLLAVSLTLNALLAAGLAVGVSVAATTSSGGGGSVSSSSTGAAVVQTVDATDWLRECVPPFKRAKFPTEIIDWSNYYQIAMPSGLCAAELACAFYACDWAADTASVLNATDLDTASINDIVDQLPPLALPASIAFPESVAALVDAVEYATSRARTISVKTSGHSYAGSSTQAGSLQLNLRSFPKYSSTSVSRCTAPSYSGGPCKLAVARGKSAIVRVGGGELWDDLYRAVIDW
jgi:hypothetical protein